MFSQTFHHVCVREYTCSRYTSLKQFLALQSLCLSVISSGDFGGCLISWLRLDGYGTVVSVGNACLDIVSGLHADWAMMVDGKVGCGSVRLEVFAFIQPDSKDSRETRVPPSGGCSIDRFRLCELRIYVSICRIRDWIMGFWILFYFFLLSWGGGSEECLVCVIIGLPRWVRALVDFGSVRHFSRKQFHFITSFSRVTYLNSVHLSFY